MNESDPTGSVMSSEMRVERSNASSNVPKSIVTLFSI